MKLAREALTLGQATFAEQNGLNVRTYRKNETGLNEAGICLAAAFIRAGINANWLLTGDGPMLLADLQRLAAPSSPKINVDALEAIIEGVLRADPKASAAHVASLAVSVYQQVSDQGLITPEGLGTGNFSNAA